MCAYKSNGNGTFADGDRRNNTNGRKMEQKRKTDVLPISTNTNGNTAPKIEVVNFDAIDEYGPSFVEAHEQTEIVTGDQEQYDKIYSAVYDLLDAFNVNWDDPNYTDTPKRVAKAYLEHWASGYARSPEDEITIFPNSSGSGDLVLVKDMKYYSTCSHHRSQILL